MTISQHSLPTATDQIIDIGNRKVERIDMPNHPLRGDTINELVMSCRNSPIEVCGFVTTTGEVHYVGNLHEEPTQNFLMDADEGREVIKEIVLRNHEAILGMFHTHPNNLPWPSPRDIVGWPNPDLGWRYWIATSRDVIEWRLH